MLSETIKKIAENNSNARPPCTFVFGTVISASPLSVKVDNRFILPSSALVTMRPFIGGEHNTHTHRHICRYNGAEVDTEKTNEQYDGIKAGDKLALLREYGGQRFLILGVIE